MPKPLCFQETPGNASANASLNSTENTFSRGLTHILPLDKVEFRKDIEGALDLASRWNQIQERIRAAGIMDPMLVNRLVRNFNAGNGFLTLQLWFVLTFEMWREQWD